MSPGAGLALGRVVVAADGAALAAAREWAWAMDEAGADALALEARPAEPATPALLEALAASGLPLELHVAGQAPAWEELAPLLDHPDLTAVVPEQAPAAEVAERLAAAGCTLAWPAAQAREAPAGIWRWHWPQPPASLATEAPFERSAWFPEAPTTLPAGLTTAVVPASALDAVDPGATIAHLHDRLPLPSGSPQA